MKKLLLLLSAIIALQSNAQTTSSSDDGESKFSFGLNGGITIASLDKNLKTNYDARGLWGYSAGLSFNFTVAKWLSLEFKPSVASINYNTKYLGLDTTMGNTIGTITSTTTNTHAILPLLADFHNTGRFKGHIYAGGFYSQLINSSVNTTNSIYQTDVTQDKTQGYYDNNNAGGGGITFGAGVGYHPQGKGVAVVLQYLFYKHLDETWQEHNNIGLNLLYAF